MITKLVTTAEMRSLEQAAVDRGASWTELMEHAGWGVAQEALRLLNGGRGRRVLALIGPGNNGGDGLVVARHLHDAGAEVQLYLWKRQGEDANRQRCRERGLAEIDAAADAGRERLRVALAVSDLVIDGLLGMGASRPVTGELAEIVAVVNEARRPPAALRRPMLLAIDLPTGVHSDSGAVLGQALQADLTVATGVCKRGLFYYPARACAGSIRLADIGIPPGNLEAIMSELLNADRVRSLLPARPVDAHKGTFGKVLVVAGSLYYPGAAVLATGGAGRVGAGLVTLAAGRSALGGGGRGPEVTLLPLPEADWGAIGPEAVEELEKRIGDYQALVVGPGLGREESTRLFIQRLLGLEQPKARGRVGFVAASAGPTAPVEGRKALELPPTVLDADGLNLLAELDEWPEHLAHNRFVFTPHPGEMRRLLKVEELGEDLAAVAGDAAARWGQVVVLKGATTVVAGPDGQTLVYDGGNPALATAGTGDVLAGAIGGLLAQGLSLFDAAALGVYLHGAAGALVREEIGAAGSLAGDLLPRLPRAIKQLSIEN